MAFVSERFKEPVRNLSQSAGVDAAAQGRGEVRAWVDHKMARWSDDNTRSLAHQLLACEGGGRARRTACVNKAHIGSLLIWQQNHVSPTVGRGTREWQHADAICTGGTKILGPCIPGA